MTMTSSALCSYRQVGEQNPVIWPDPDTIRVLATEAAGSENPEMTAFWHRHVGLKERLLASPPSATPRRPMHCSRIST